VPGLLKRCMYKLEALSVCFSTAASGDIVAMHVKSCQ
jgi:hypothetical protein